ncbi:MAG TPA: hypothetical protein PKH78_04120, partial [Candidatus Obscuribacter sp.]|nr:hypothetical protein [Candidatus Obscuribacter sp.]
MPRFIASITRGSGAGVVVLASAALLGAFSVNLLSAPAVSAQAAGANQTIYRDEQDLLQTDQAMINEYKAEERDAEQKLSDEETKNQPYRLYAEKRIQVLKKAK